MDIKQATTAYEAWVAKQLPLIDADLELKHQRMAESPFPFLRATFYRWVQLWPAVCPNLARAPQVLGIGDLHVENFGTWRDCEGRLVWGVNDFDEACSLPYTNDLVRLAVSVKLAVAENGLSCKLDAACAAILQGYQKSLANGGQPMVLADRHNWLREVATGELRDPIRFWDKLNRLPDTAQPVPPAVRKALQQALPQPKLPCRIVHRQAGLGSLGRRRFTALAEWCGGMIAREAKELRLSAWHWEDAGQRNGPLHYREIVDRAVRAPDPFLDIKRVWLLRRLAPDCSRVELSSLPKMNDELKLLAAMGWETANVHIGTKLAIRKIAADLRSRPAKWLRKATEDMADATNSDWKEWKAGRK
jgi:uncharacterized protein DUF2252